MKKVNEQQIEKLMAAMDIIHEVQTQLEEQKNTKRICKQLDDCIGNLYNVIHE